MGAELVKCDWRSSSHLCPADFEAVFIEIGRQACESHYGVGRSKIDQWLCEKGKERLIQERAEYVRPAGFRSRAQAIFLAALEKGATVKEAHAVAGVSDRAVYYWRKADHEFAVAWKRALANRITRSEMTKAPFSPYTGYGRISLTLVRHAAQYLRSVRNGGWIISQASNGDWWVGSRRRTAAELLDFAMKKGFAPNLPLQSEDRVGCGRL